MRINLDGIASTAPRPLVPGGFDSNLDQNNCKTTTETTTASTSREAGRQARREATKIVTASSAVANDKEHRRQPPGEDVAQEEPRQACGRRRKTRPEDKDLDVGQRTQQRQQYKFNLAQYSKGDSNQESGAEQQRQMDEVTIRRIRETVGKFMGVAPLLSSTPTPMQSLSVAAQVTTSSNRELLPECNPQSTMATKLATTSFNSTINNNNINMNMNNNAAAQLVPADLSTAGPFGPTPLNAQSNHFQFGSPIVAGTSTDSPLESMMAAVAARYRQHDQHQHQALLSQFASLHGLSAVASAIQKQSVSSLQHNHHQNQHNQQRKQARAQLQPKVQTQAQSTTGFDESSRSNQQLGAQNHQFALNQHNHPQFQPHHQPPPPPNPISTELAYLSQQFNLSNQLVQQIGRLHQQRQQQETTSHVDNKSSSNTAEHYQPNVQSFGPHLQFGPHHNYYHQHPLAATAEARTRLIDNDNQTASRTKTTTTTTITTKKNATATPTTTTGELGAQRSRKRRRGSRKCRKVYGMAQRQMWCTQCKWKKACSRFAAQQHYQLERQQVTTTTGAGGPAGSVARRLATNYSCKSRQSSAAEARNQKPQLDQANSKSDQNQRLDIGWPVSIV